MRENSTTPIKGNTPNIVLPVTSVTSVELLRQVAKRYGTPCYVMVMDQISERIAAIDHAFQGHFGISYAVKSNPNPALLGWLKGRVPYLDVSSGGELQHAVDCGWEPQRLSFTGPGKTDAELQSAVKLRIGDVVVESLNEAHRLNAMAGHAGHRQPIIIRVSPAKLPPGFGVKMGGKPSQFGIDEEELEESLGEILSLAHLRVAGFHIYSGAQCLKEDAIIENYRHFIALFDRAAAAHDLAPDRCIFGSSLGIPYYDGDEPLDLTAIGAAITPQLANLRSKARYADTRFVLETGRYLVGEAGVFLTSLVNIKQSRGAMIGILDGGMNHNLAACGHLGTVIHRNYQMFKVPLTSKSDGAQQAFDLYGPLCTSIDMVARGVSFPGLEIGDGVALMSSGAYGVSASPIHFISHNGPREIFVEQRNGVPVMWESSPYRRDSTPELAQTA